MKMRQEEPPKGSAAWMATFSDLMNLLLCFFVLLFSMSTIDAEKFQQIVAAMANNISFMPSGGATIGEGSLISSGASHLTELDDYYNDLGVNADNEDPNATDTENPFDKVEQEQNKESEGMAEDIQQGLTSNGLTQQIDVVVTTQYVSLNIKSGILFDSGKAELKADSIAVLEKVAKVLKAYDEYTIEVIGHTDNVPINTAQYADNTELSLDRGYNVYKYLVNVAKFDSSSIKPSGKGEFDPIASNATAAGRSQNRRVEIRIYNKLSGI